MADTGGAQDKAAAVAQDKAGPTAVDSGSPGRRIGTDRGTRRAPAVVGPEKVVVVGGD